MTGLQNTHIMISGKERSDYNSSNTISVYFLESSSISLTAFYDAMQLSTGDSGTKDEIPQHVTADSVRHKLRLALEWHMIL